MKDEKYHEPVLVKEVLAHLNKKFRVIDATLGTGGHTEAMIKAGMGVLGIEADPEMLKIAKERLPEADLIYGNFCNIDQIARENGFGKVEAVLFDLGVSNPQLMDKSRGFSFNHPAAKLDLRIDPGSQGLTGADLLNSLREDQLTALFMEVMDLSASRFLTKRVVGERILKKFESVGDFLKVCEGVRGKPRIHPATLPFLALRIAVNLELDNLREALPKAFGLISPGGKLLVITFHSGEEKVVRNFPHRFIGPVRPTAGEIRVNPRSRSAELFVFEKK